MHAWLPSQDWVDRVAGAAPGVQFDVYDGKSEPPSSQDKVEFYAVPFPTSAAAVEVIQDLPSLRVVQTHSVGVDAVRAAVPDGVSLCNAKGVFDAPTAEHALSLILASVRRIPDLVRDQDQHAWRKASFPGFSPGLADRTVLIVGYGSIGRAIEARLLPFEPAEILRVARTPRDGVAGIDALPGLLPQADVIVLIVPLTDQTRGLVDADFLARMKDGALLVNMARGPVVRTEDLVRELASGRLCAAVDVTDPEPLPPDSPLWDAPNTLITPHLAGLATPAFQPRMAAMLTEQLRRYTAGEPLLNLVTGEY